MQLKRKSLKKLLSGALALAMTASLALPMVVAAEDPAAAPKEETLARETDAGEMPESPYTCSSEGKDTHKASIKFNGSYWNSNVGKWQETEPPAAAGAHLVYYDDGVRYEGEKNKAFDIYEGCSAYVSVDYVPGYSIYVTFPESIETTTYDGADVSMRYFDDYADENGMVRFTMPEVDLPITVWYEESSDFTVRFPDGAIKTVKCNEPITMPAAPTKDIPEGGAFAGWIFAGKLYQPGETVRFDYDLYYGKNMSGEHEDEVADIGIEAMWVPKVDVPDYMDISYSLLDNFGMKSCSKDVLGIASGTAKRKMNPVVVRFTINAEKLPAGQVIESARLMGVPVDSLDGKSVELGSGSSLYAGMGYYETISTRLGTIQYSDFSIEASLTKDTGKETVFDLRKGYTDPEKVSYSDESSLASLLDCGRFDVQDLFVDRSGTATEELYWNSMDLNSDGHIDLRMEPPVFPYSEEMSYSLDGESVSPETREGGVTVYAVRMQGAEKCEKPGYAFKSGMAEYGTVKVKLFDSCIVKFTDDGKVLSEEEIRKGKNVTKPADPAREGYTFKGWSIAEGADAGKLFDFKTSVTGDLTLKAVWEKVTPKTEPVPEPTVVGASVGTKLTVGKIVYVVTKQGDANNLPEVTYSVDKKNQGKKKTVKVPDTITVDGVTYKVTALEKNALANEKKAKTIILGKYIKSVPAKAVKGCKKLKTFKLTNTDEVVKLNKKFLAGTKGKIKLLVPKAFYNDYKKQIKKLKLTKKVTLKKF